MGLPDSYTLKTGGIPAYFDAIKNAQAPERFSYKFLSDLDFTSSNDRLIVGILKDLGFLNTDGVPTERYYQFLDKDQSAHVLAEGIREAYSDLFAVNKDAHKLNVDEVTNKLRTLYKGSKKDSVIKLIAKTFVALCEVADFSKPKMDRKDPEKAKSEDHQKNADKGKHDKATALTDITLDSLQYHINIVLPETRDQAVYDAIFKSLRDHLG
jgi:hypothetical protein